MQVVGLDLLDAIEQRVEIVIDREVTTGHAVAATGGKLDDQASCLLGFGSVTGFELIQHPPEHAPSRAGRVDAVAAGRVAETDRQ